MLFRIICVSPDGKEAYAELVESATVLNSDGRCIIHSFRGDCYFANKDELIEDPEIIRESSPGWLFKIRLEG